ERIHELKARDEGKSSAVMFFAPLAMRGVLSTLGPRTREAIATLLPGPLTLVVHNPDHRYPLACREDPERLGLRLIDGPLAGERGASRGRSWPPGSPTSAEPRPPRALPHGGVRPAAGHLSLPQLHITELR